MTTREEHLEWCKKRAHEELEASGKNAAIASMSSDLNKWKGGPLYDSLLISTMMLEAGQFRNTDAQMRDWIDGFN